jgi:hypothetical protein
MPPHEAPPTPTVDATGIKERELSDDRIAHLADAERT